MISIGMDEYMKVSRRCDRIGKDLRKDWDSPRRWNLIREYYKEVEPLILDGSRISPYGIPLADYMTPIDRAIWNDIRCYGLPFYMQYPVGRRFVDFGDPITRIAIEVDGKAYHSAEKDAPKNAEIRAAGWRLFRIKGSVALYKEDAIADVLHAYGKEIYREDEWQEQET